MLAPNAVRVLQHIVPDMRPASQKQSVSRAISRLIKQGYIARTRNGRYALTDTGQVRLVRTMSYHASVVRGDRDVERRRWDGKWRVVVFDIQERQRHKRDELREMLGRTGFTRLQDSVWVYPFRCDEVVALVKMHLTLGYKLVYMIADAIENDDWLRQIYDLPPAAQQR